MFCDQCGGAIQAGQNFCSKCGKAIAASPVSAVGEQSRVARHAHILGILWLALSALDGVQGVIAYVVANTVFNPVTHFERPHFLHVLLTLVGSALILKTFAGFAVGWGLLRRETWARGTAIVLAIVSLFFNVPFGTALGIYTLWLLLPDTAEREFRQMAQAA